jgi:hypothetical protein
MVKTWQDYVAQPPVGSSQPFVLQKREKVVADWRKRISDHIAYALLVYTGLQIAITISALRHQGTSLLPYLALILLVVAVVPACRAMERRWTALSDAQAADPARAKAFRRDRAVIWIAAIGAPILLGAFFRLMSLALS